jgi:hypothetical protein
MADVARATLADPLVSILVLNWNSCHLTVECVESLRSLDYGNHEVVLIDNGSEDGSEALLRTTFPDLKLIQTGRNLGYAGGNNRGIAHALSRGSEYIWLLNNDTRVHPGALRALVDALATRPQAGIAGSKIFSMEDPERLSYAGGRFDPWKGRALHQGREETDHGQYDRLETTDFVTGCSLLVRASVVRTVGPMDERFFLYYEDLDWNLRIQQAGFQSLYVPTSVLWHREGGSLGRSLGKTMKPDVVYYVARNSLYFYARHLPPLQRWSSVAWSLQSQWRTLRRLCREGSPLADAYRRALSDAYRDYRRQVWGRRPSVG